MTNRPDSSPAEESSDQPSSANLTQSNGRLSSGIDLMVAIRRVEKLPPLGHCSQLIEIYQNYHEFEEIEVTNVTAPVENTNHEAMLGILKQVYKDFPVPNASGDFNSFNLRITRPGCEYDGPIEPYRSPTNDLIPEWFEHSTVSGYGDNKSLETKIDHNVRSAREILPAEFSVEPQLIDLIQKTWAAHFIPAHVRVEPYKIHLYGPGGHFKSHCDTPEKGLVGTFLVGLGDTSPYDWPGHFNIGDEAFRADSCSWVAFHPDILHSVSKLKKSHHRAVIAFKVFHDDTKAEDAKLPELERRLRETLDQMEPPYAILLDHKYCIGTTEMSGFDSVILASARSRTDVHVHPIPVVTQFRAEYSLDDNDLPSAGCNVYPLTEAHVDILLKRNVEQAKGSIKWLKGVQNVPFYCLQDDMSAAFLWHSDKRQGAEYTGNSSEPAREDSIYLNYAMLVLGSTVPTNDGSETSGSDA